MVLLGQQTALVRHRGPSRRTLIVGLATLTALGIALAALVVWQHNDRPPWADDIAYEAGYVHGNRVRQTDVPGKRTQDLLTGGCVRLESEGLGGQKATHNPGLWVAGCLDGAAGRPR
ncbi:hypothetical protein [Streptomyces sp. NPDC000410]|uniref:hypothetical protein n=1 Tax=Streptomyces sp. NPDC000410 TaxID=3154254 RepID=UPI00332AFCEC